MSDYQTLPFRLVDIGLNLRDAVDKVPQGKWVRLTNCRSTQEALLATRAAIQILFTLPNFPPIHTIRRLNQDILVVGAGTQIFGNASEYVIPTTDPATGNAIALSGEPLGMVPYRPELSTDPWMYVADSGMMLKLDPSGRAFKWGITPPSQAPIATVSSAGGLSTAVPGAVAYTWEITYYSTLTGAESDGSPESNSLSGTSFRAQVVGRGSRDPQVDKVRLYRLGGTNISTRRFVEEVDNPGDADVTFFDANADSVVAVNKPIPTTNLVPFTSVDGQGNTVLEAPMPFIAGPFLGKYIFACGDPNRPGFLYWTNSESPDAASSANNVQVTSPAEPLIGLLLFGSLPYVFSRDNLYAIDFGQAGITFRGRLTACGRGLSSPWAFAVGDFIYFLSQDGIYRTTGETQAESITNDALRPIFQGLAVSGFEPVDYNADQAFRLFYAGQELHFLYQDTSGVQQHLFWHSEIQRWKKLQFAAPPSVIYTDENQVHVHMLIGSTNGAVYHLDHDSPASGFDEIASTTIIPQPGGAGDPVFGQYQTASGSVIEEPIEVNARTGSLDFDAPGSFKEFGGAIVDVDLTGGGIITLTPYLNAEASNLTPQVVSGTGRQKVFLSLEDTYAYSIAYDISWTEIAKMYQFEILWRMDEQAIKHWEFPETSHGLSGWQQVRDAYFALRSNADVTLTLEVDGRSYTFTLPSTSGARRKVYAPLRGVKGKVFRWKLDSTDVFRLYGEDCEVRTKIWNSALGYELVSPFRKAS